MLAQILSDPEMIGTVAIATWSVASIWVKPSSPRLKMPTDSR
jgi:hypothetical protein